jgi:hypothetical protein
MSFAATEAAGVPSSVADGQAAFRFGKAAYDGQQAATFALHGLTGPPEPLEGKSGLIDVMFHGHADYVGMLDGLGSVWEADAIVFDRSGYPFGRQPQVAAIQDCQASAVIDETSPAMTVRPADVAAWYASHCPASRRDPIRRVFDHCAGLDRHSRPMLRLIATSRDVANTADF